MPDYETFEHDVLVIGAGGAGLRAAIEASVAGVRVGLVCKSLLGKAHTVMAEGGIAAALANVDESRVSAPKRWCWPLAELGGRTKLPATVGSTPATVTRSLMTQVQI